MISLKRKLHWVSTLFNLISWLKLILLVWILICKTSSTTARKVWRRVEAISDREAVLPCEVGIIDEGDMIYVVLWYLNGQKEPIYSFDNRPRALQALDDRHIIQSPSLEGRASFRSGSVPALHIKPVLSRDQANYTCRVDFRFATSRATHLSLRVVVPPSTPELKMNGRSVYNTLFGPLLEGQTLRISCLVMGGEPPPDVVWVKDGMVIDSSIESQTSYRTINKLIIPRLSRAFHDSRLTCKAFNNNVTAPAFNSVVLTMNLKPLETRLRAPPRMMRVRQSYAVTCITVGSRPHPNITWTLGNIASVISLQSESEHGMNSSISTARLKAIRRFHGQRLTCSVVNSLFPKHVLSDSFILNVTYPPVAALELGRGVAQTVKEGEDVYFNCMVDSNPPIYKTRWYHENTLLRDSPEDGILISGDHSLAIRGIIRNQAGEYMCSASNVEGDAKSAPLYLEVSYSPICALPESNSKMLASALGQPLNVTCDVIASPGEIKYSWVFNNSITSERVQGDRVYFNADGDSGVRFIARTPQEYGTLQCWAENIVGRMTVPCFYHIIPARRPDPPVNCAVANKTYDSLVVLCSPGFNGGLEQIFEARVYESDTGLRQQNETSYVPYFILKGLTPGLDYVIAVTSKNILGKSEPQKLEAFTYKMAENRMRNEQISGISRTPPGSLAPGAVIDGSVGGMIVALLVGAVILLGAATVLFFVARSIHYRRNRPYGKSDDRNTHFIAPESAETEVPPITTSLNSPVKRASTPMEGEMQTTFEFPAIPLESRSQIYTHADDPL